MWVSTWPIDTFLKILQVFSASPFQKGLESSQFPASQVQAPINCHTHCHKCHGLGEPGTDEIPFYDKEIVYQDTLGLPFGHHLGLSY